jgi:hypothetical protein
MKIVKTYNQVVNESDNHHLLTQDQIDWILEHSYFTNFVVTDDGQIAYPRYNNLIYLSGNFKSIPVKFADCKVFSISDNSELEDLEGCPDHVETSFKLEQCPSLKSLKGAPKTAGSVLLDNVGVGNLIGIPKGVKDFYLVTNCEHLESIEGIPYDFNPDKIFVSNNYESWDKLKEDFARGYSNKDLEDFKQDWEI